MFATPLADQTGTPLTLPEAVSMALGKNPLHVGARHSCADRASDKAAIADTRISAAAVREARSSLMPKIMFTESAVRGNDPVFVFGAKKTAAELHSLGLRFEQTEHSNTDREFLQQFLGQWSLFDGRQSWFGLSCAKYLQQAVEQQLDRTDQELVYQAVRA